MICDGCDKELSVENLKLICYICDADIEFFDLESAKMMLDEKCGSCAGHPTWDADFYSIEVAGSWSEYYRGYDWSVNRRSEKELQREGRTDYWEGVVHFCTADEFISIYHDRRIIAYPTGLYYKKCPDLSKSVCLTEATQSNWDEIKKVHGKYGFVFRKRDIIGLNGSPAIYLPQKLIDEIKASGAEVPDLMKPFVTKLKLQKDNKGSRQDFLHEREWRVPCDISLDDVAPFAVTFPSHPPNLPDEESILRAAVEFREISEMRKYTSEFE